MDSKAIFAIYSDGKWSKISTKSALRLSLRQICNHSIALRISLDCREIYFTDYDELWLNLESQGKTVKSFLEIFSLIECELKRNGHSDSVFDLPVGEFFFLSEFFSVFPGSKLVSMAR